MKTTIKAQALYDDGSVAWGYFHEEYVPEVYAKDLGIEVSPAEMMQAIAMGEGIPEDAQRAFVEAEAKTASRVLEQMIERLSEAKDALTDQAAATVLSARQESPHQKPPDAH